MSYLSKTSAWNLWDIYPAVTQRVAKLSCQPSIEDVWYLLQNLGSFNVLLYDRNWNSLSTNKCRGDLFCRGGIINNTPNTGSPFLTYTTSALCCRLCIGSRLCNTQTLPPADLWWWNYEGNTLTPGCADLPEASRALRELVKCKCKLEKNCRALCIYEGY